MYILEDYHPYHTHGEYFKEQKIEQGPPVKQQIQDNEDIIDLRIRKTPRRRAQKSKKPDPLPEPEVNYEYNEEYDIWIGTILGYDQILPDPC